MPQKTVQPQASAPAQDMSGVASMAEFVAKHGEEGVPTGREDQRLEDKGGRKPAPVKPETDTQPPPQGDAGDEPEYDRKTLEDLGLLPSSAEKPEADGEDEGGTRDSEIDLHSLATAIGAKPEDLVLKDGTVRVKTKVDGEDGEVPFEELRKGYQLQSHLTRQQQQFLKEKEHWDGARQQAEDQLKQQAVIAAGVLQQQEQALVQEYTIDWNELRQTDPAEYAARQAEFSSRLQGLRGQQQQMFQALQQRQVELQQETQKKTTEHMKREAATLAKLQGWEDPKKWKENMGALNSYLKDQYGFDDATVSGISDHRAFLVIEKARKYDALMKKVDTLGKKVPEQGPSVPSGSGTVPAGRGRKKQYQAAQDKLAKSGNMADAAALFNRMPGIL